MADQATLHFGSWRRNALFDGAERVGGRLKGKLKLSLSDDLIGVPSSGDAAYTLMGAADVGALRPGAITQVAPAPFSRDAETTKLVHVDLREPDLPWRYTPRETPGAESLAPWLVLLVGTAEEIRVEGGVVAQVEQSVLLAHPLEQSHTWAHTQRAGDRTTARILSPRGTEPRPGGIGVVGLAAQREHVAVLVPSFNDAGEQMWDAAGVLQLGSLPALPALHSWRFWTAEAGDFETLAAALRVPLAGDVGKARLQYRRLDLDDPLEVRGAITSLQQQETPADTAAVMADLALLGEEVEGTLGRPALGRPWMPEPDDADSGWAHDLNDDPRFRGSAGLGAWMGVEGQEALMAAAVAQAGALREAGQRIGDLAMGLEAAGRIWERRLPAEPLRRLGVLGPMTARIAADGGVTVLDRITTGTSPLDPALLSGAAQRLLRGRNRAAALAWAADPAPEPERTPSGVPHLDEALGRLGLPPVEELFEVDDAWLDEVIGRVADLLRDYGAKYADLVRSDARPEDVTDLVDELRRSLQDLLQEHLSDRQLPCEGAQVLDRAAEQAGEQLSVLLRRALRADQDGWGRARLLELVRRGVRRCMASRRCREIFQERRRRRGRDETTREVTCDVVVDHVPGPDQPPHRPIDLVGVSVAVSNGVDPRLPDPPGKVRLCHRLVGVDCGDLRPPEFPIGLDFPTWSLLKQHDREWLLPGADTLEKDSVTALQTNPAFVDAFMVGINTQFMSEMRWRDLAVERTCTPLRMFWGQVDHTTGTRSADIEPLDQWAAAPEERIGALAHQTIKPHDPGGNPTGARLVITFRSDLFRRYPATLVYLVRPAPGDDVDAVLSAPPELQRPDAGPAPETWRANRKHFGPVLAGTLTPELVFFAFDVTPTSLDEFWLVLDEPPAELRFRNDETIDTTSAATYAKTALDQPTRVAISGASLELAGRG